MTSTEFVNASDGSLLRLIPEGNAVLGSHPEQIAYAIRLDKDGNLFSLTDETPQFEAFIRSFYIGVFAVTNRQFARFLTATRPPLGVLNLLLPWRERIHSPDDETAPYDVVRGFENHPVTNVSWFGAQAYCAHVGLRLPKELEWEKAARGTDGRIFPWGNRWEPNRLCWHGSHLESVDTVPVDCFENGCSPYGIFQLAGNVEEWCADWYQARIYDSYAAGQLLPPRHGLGRVIRGGNCRRRNKLEFRCAMRRGNRPAYVNTVLTGIRCAADEARPGSVIREVVGHRCNATGKLSTLEP
jgi:formylglycine-generating enzyme required for sulfatase activity